MGFEVEKKRKNEGELWDQYDKSSYSKPVRTDSIIQPKSGNSARQGKSTVNTYKKKTSSGMSGPSASSGRQKSSAASVVIVFAVIMVCCAIFFSSAYDRRRTVSKQSEPMNSSLKLSLLSSMVPFPSGMKYDYHEMNGLTLTIYVKGNADTSVTDYLSSSTFALGLAEQANRVKFVEEETGKEYTFERAK